MRAWTFLATLSALLVFSACEPGCTPPPPAGDGGVDGGGEGEGEGEGEPEDAGERDASVVIIGECNQDTPTFGDECGACGTVVCDPVTDSLICNDPGLNACNACGNIDESEGFVGESCGEFGCGIAICNADGTATECVGDREPNACGGCFDLPPNREPGEICSNCNSGLETCTRDRNNLVCFRGREPAFDGDCSRRILAHAFMDERLQGSFIRNGTTAIFENVNDTFDINQLSFDPLVEGPGTAGLVLAHLIISPVPELNIVTPPNNGVCLSEFDCPPGFDCVGDTQAACVEGQWMPSQFSADIINVPGDPVRQYSLAGFDFQTPTQYLIIYDWFFNETISVGEIVLGEPPGYVDVFPQPPDAGVPNDDAGVDAGAIDAGAVDAGVSDGGAPDAGDAG